MQQPVLPSHKINKQQSVLEHTVTGSVLRFLFKSEDDTYSVLKLRSNDNNEYCLVGFMPGLLEGQDIEATGHWQHHKEHGRQLQVTSFKAVLPSTVEGIERYLGSSLVKGIGPTYAKRIVKHFGVKTLQVLDKHPERLSEVPGIGKKRFQEIKNAWSEQVDQRDMLVFLQGLGITNTYCKRIMAKYGEGSAEVVRRNPFQLADEISGIGFFKADNISRKLGIPDDSPYRLAAGIKYIMQQKAENGHCCALHFDLMKEALELLKVNEQALQVGLQQALVNGFITKDISPRNAEIYYLHKLYDAECNLASSLAGLLMNPGKKYSLPQLGPDFEKLNKMQKQAVLTALKYRVSIITGGPGVGKTTVIGQIVAAAARLSLKVTAAAPTGRAAKRLSEATGINGKTIHRMLKWEPQKGGFFHCADAPLRTDILIIDEVSMMDIELAEHLFQAISYDTHVVLVGDRDQLPSVGPGAVLFELIHSKCIPVTNLTEIYRQAAGSRIITNSHMVNKGMLPDLKPVGKNEQTDFYWIDNEDPEKAAEVICRMLTDRIPKSFNVDPLHDVQVLSPMHRGSCGSNSLNYLLQKQFVTDKNISLNFGERVFYLKDKVMQISNNYDKSVFNGDLGNVVFIDTKNRTLTVEYEEQRVIYEQEELNQLTLAYAITIHKSQGCEFPVVIIPMLTQHYVMLQRNLLYTGMTRARQILILIGSQKAMRIAVSNSKSSRRYTLLAHRLRSSFSQFKQQVRG